MTYIPSLPILQASREYLDAAEYLSRDSAPFLSFGFAPHVLAAFSLELSFKSCLAQEALVRSPDGTSEVFEKSLRGHKLNLLFKEFEPSIASVFLSHFKKTGATEEFQLSLSMYSNYFEGLRYAHEPRSKHSAMGGVIVFARHVYDAVLAAAHETHGNPSFLMKTKLVQNAS
jgi:hypothetical protein